MSKNKKLYWQGIEQLPLTPKEESVFQKEFPEELPVKEKDFPTRRDFLKLMGFSITAASLAACEAPVRKAIPYLNKPVEIEPGVANYYASSYVNGGNYCSVVVKTREGRPIKITGNTLSKVSNGATNAQVEASVLSLYDTERLTSPYIKEKKTTWKKIDKEVIQHLKDLSSKGETIWLVTKTILSPSFKNAINDFIKKYPTTKVVTYDPISSYGILAANKKSFDQAVIPSYHFEKAKTIVSFSCDFIGTWINPAKFSRDFVENRKLGNGKKQMSCLYQFEANLSLTGANADYRIPVKPSDEYKLLVTLHNEIAKILQHSTIQGKEKKHKLLSQATRELIANKGKSLVVSGNNDTNIQIIVNAINHMLNNYGSTIDLNNPLHYRQGDDRGMRGFVSEMNAGAVSNVIFLNCNPVYDYALGEVIAQSMEKVSLKISTSDRKDETASLTDYIAPDHHFLESWGDAEPQKNSFSLIQPSITPLFDTRQTPHTLLMWAEEKNVDYYEYVKKSWKQSFEEQSTYIDFDEFCKRIWHDGVFNATPKTERNNITYKIDQQLLAKASSTAQSTYAPKGKYEVVLYEKVSIGDGSQANNPWLQEMPDPITKACWDNYLTVNPSWAQEHGVVMKEGATKVATININGKRLELPIMVQPGQAKGTFGIAVGYGRVKAGKVADNIGVNAFSLLTLLPNGETNFVINSSNIEITVTEKAYRIPQMQTHSTHMQRDNVIQETTLKEYQQNEGAGRSHPYIATSKGKVKPKNVTLWHGHKYPNHHWGMVIDMNSCVGCNACVISCQTENNVPVVGKEEVLNRREMHWLRIDRYYSSDAEGNDLKGLEVAAKNPEVSFQPMMCQHCNNAPCETVCPVVATTHSTEGLNQMTYNRCVGTRYCANNCPYKVRRFNWFKYHDNKNFPDNLSMNNSLGKMVLNPDVVVRSRGVMEKCSFCIQRIQEGKLNAKKEKRKIKDEDVVPACASACPTKAIVFGDMKNPKSKISKLLKLSKKETTTEIQEPRAYHMLEELNVSPNIWYLTKVRNKKNNLL